jgi:hypothetical protein
MRRRLLALAAAVVLAFGLLALGMEAASATTITSPHGCFASSGPMSRCRAQSMGGEPALPDQTGASGAYG